MNYDQNVQISDFFDKVYRGDVCDYIKSKESEDFPIYEPVCEAFENIGHQKVSLTIKILMNHIFESMEDR